MNLKQRLARINRETIGTPTLADQFKGVSDSDIRRDVATARVGKAMSLSGRNIDADHEVKRKLAA